LLLLAPACGRFEFALVDRADAAVDAMQCELAADIRDGLLLHWEFEDDVQSLTAMDSSGSGNHGVRINLPTFVPGKIGQGMGFGDQLGGSQDQRVRKTSASFDSTGDLTLVLWAFSVNTGAIDVLVDTDQNNTSTFRVLDRDTTPTHGNLRVSSDGLVSADAVAESFAYNIWQHIAIVRPASGDGVGIYMNGTLQTASADSGTPVANTTFQIGGAGDTSSDFNGVLDDIRVYGRLLSIAEITHLYNRTCP
jgi:hypothetical protein